MSPPSTLQRGRPTLIAHRGASDRYPENTMVAYQAAVDAGAKFVELDVQLASDLVPIVHHDQDLTRMTGTVADLTQMISAEVLKLPGSYPERFGSQFSDNPLASLSEFVHWISQYPDVTVFVEIKRQSVEVFGADRTATSVIDIIRPIGKQAVVISFDRSVLVSVRSIAPQIPIGWVLREYNDENHRHAERLEPEYLFCKTTRIPLDRKVWPGDWQWVLYNTDTVNEAMDFYESGFDMLETNRIVDLLGSNEFCEHE
ncbi:MAG: hypothetical protein HKN47_16530 [Pirellulaceae bacterium]|nr:hypothetical protein [Pirellulaceae bacterium]